MGIPASWIITHPRRCPPVGECAFRRCLGCYWSIQFVDREYLVV